MKYWMIALQRDDMEHCIKVGTFGLKRKYILGNVKKGDRIACFVTREQKIIALGDVTSDYYVDDSNIFRTETLCPDRFDFKVEKLSEAIDFMRIIDKMSFISNLAYWSVYFRNGIVEMSAKDWETLKQSAASTARA